MAHHQRIVIQNLTYKTPNNQLLFAGLNLTLTEVKTGLIGKNGSGKSTLLKLIVKELLPITGTIKVLGNIAYCPQDFTSYYNTTIAQFFAIEQKIAALASISQGNCNPENFTTLAEDWNIKVNILKQAKVFSLKIENFSAKIGSLSNGEITKLWLTKLFYQQKSTDFLILDEPTNNLDITTRDILYNVIQKWPGGTLIISHDQSLLELMQQTVTLTERGSKTYGGNYSFYKKQNAIEHLAKEQCFNDAQKHLKKITALIQTTHERHQKNQAQGKRARRKNDQPKAMLDFAKNRNDQTARTLSKQATRLLATAEENLQQAKDNLDPAYTIKVSLPQTFVPQNKIVATIEKVNFRYAPDQNLLLKDFSLIIRGPEHLAICGANGSGKTTFLKLMQKALTPESGYIVTNVTAHYLDQRLEILQPQLSILENYKILNPQVTDNEARMNLAKFLFRNDAVLKKTENLSCGERIRAALACVLLAEKPPELLMLDEPTNHLDLENLACLISILKNFEGALIIVSHDKKFLDELAIDNIITFDFIK